MTPTQQRAAAVYLQEHFGISQRRASQLLGRPRSTLRYQPQPRDEENDVWTYDFIADRTVDGRSLKWLSLVDEYTRECLALVAAATFTGSDVRRCWRG